MLSSALTVALAAVGATVDVVSTVGFPTSGFIKIDNEIISYTGVNPLQFTGCLRGQNETIAVAHLVGALASQASGFDVLIGTTSKNYVGGLNGTAGFTEQIAGDPTLNRFAISQP